MALKFYWDACVCIDWIQNQDAAKRALLQPIITAAANGDAIIVASSLVLAEVVRANGDQPMTDEEDGRIRLFFLHPYVEVRPIDARVAHLARTIMRSRLSEKAANPTAKKIPLHDAIHIATALDCGCDALQSFDANDMLVEHQKHGFAGRPSLRIELPSYTPPPPPAVTSGQGTLFDAVPPAIGSDPPTA